LYVHDYPKGIYKALFCPAMIVKGREFFRKRIQRDDREIDEKETFWKLLSGEMRDCPVSCFWQFRLTVCCSATGYVGCPPS
jgi:hypothetical protein